MELRPGFKRTEVGVIPEEWDEVLLDQVAKRGSGHTPDKKRRQYWNGRIKWISLADSPALDRVYIDDTSAKVTPAGIANSSAVVHPAGTVVLSRDAGIGKSAIMQSDMAVSQHFMAWTCGPELSNLYLYYWLQFNKPQFERIANGSTIKTIGLPYFRDLKISRPPVEEQRAIAAALSDVDALLGGLDRLIAKKRNLKLAVMQQLLTGQNRLPGFHGEWEVKRLGDVADIDPENLGAGTSPDYAFNYIALEDVDRGSLRSHSEQIFSRAPSRARRKLRPEDILVSTVRPNLQSHLLFRGIAGNWICSTGFCVLRCREGVTSPAYVFSHLFTASVSRQIDALLTGSNYPAINSGDVRALEIAMPEYDEQAAIAAVLSDIDAELAALEARRDKTRALKQAMMQELLTGRTRLV
jgi:type I restriction enzyme S subunit